MKRTIFAALMVMMIIIPALPALAAGSCCVEMQPNSSTVLSCAQMLDTTCPTGTTPVDCSIPSQCSAFAKPESPAASEAPTKAEFPIIMPKIPLNIPTISLPEFANVTQKDGYIYIPFISIFLVGAYKMGVGVAAVLAVIMIMAGGFIWIAAAGDSGKIGQAKKMITGAVVGLILTVGSYVALQTVNPDLVNFTALKIKTVDQRIADIIDDYNPEADDAAASGGTPANAGGSSLPASQLDPIFAKYAPCAGVTPDTLKAIAQAESGLNPTKVNKSGYTGLFQTKAGNCPSSVKSYCNDLTNPDNNTAAGAAMIKSSVATISSRCPNASAHDQMVMIYIGHNMGGGMLKYVTQNSCNVAGMRQAAIDYYVNNPKTANSYAPMYQPGCVSEQTAAGDPNPNATCTGGKKFDYAVKTADKSSVSRVLDSSGSCPY